MTQITMKYGVDPDKLYKITDVAGMFNVDPKTVGRWVQDGKFGRGREEEDDGTPEGWLRTPGGHRRVWGHAIITAIQKPYIPPARPDLKEEL